MRTPTGSTNAATNEASETYPDRSRTAIHIAVVTLIAMGVRARKTPAEVATPFPPPFHPDHENSDQHGYIEKRRVEPFGYENSHREYQCGD